LKWLSIVYPFIARWSSSILPPQKGRRTNKARRPVCGPCLDGLRTGVGRGTGLRAHVMLKSRCSTRPRTLARLRRAQSRRSVEPSPTEPPLGSGQETWPNTANLGEMPSRPSVSYSRSPNSYRMAAAATSPAVSARRMRGPRLMGMRPYCRASSTSSGVKPPSGPTKMFTEKGGCSVP